MFFKIKQAALPLPRFGVVEESPGSIWHPAS